MFISEERFQAVSNQLNALQVKVKALESQLEGQGLLTKTYQYPQYYPFLPTLSERFQAVSEKVEMLLDRFNLGVVAIPGTPARKELRRKR